MDHEGQGIKADTMKLFGNSAYGKTITNKHQFSKVSLCNSREALKKVNRPTCKMLEELDSNLYEVTEFNKHIVQDLPLQIEFFVYQEAKLHMLKLYSQERRGLSYFYGKRVVLPDGVSTAPTQL